MKNITLNNEEIKMSETDYIFCDKCNKLVDIYHKYYCPNKYQNEEK